MDGYAIRWAREEDHIEILNLMRNSLSGEMPWTNEYWRWKHVDNPFGESYVLVAEANDEVIGLRVFMKWVFQCGKEKIAAVQAVDTVTRPDWRGRGVFTNLTQHLLKYLENENVAFVFNTPNANSRPGYVKMGWEIVKVASQWYRPCSLRRLMAVALLEREVTPLSQTTRHPTIDELLAKPKLPSFLARINPEEGFWTDRSTAYLRWRYREIPNFKYHGVADIQDGQGGALIYRFKSLASGLRVLVISEILIGPSSREQRRTVELIQGLLASSEADYVMAKDTLNPALMKILLLAGFVIIPRSGSYFAVRLLGNRANIPDPRHRRNWHHSIGDLALM